jgi:imidazolonepropionase-like amidohydrolase
MSLALTGGTIYTDPAAEPLRASIVVEDGTIAAIGEHIPDGAEILDCSGLTITAGFWNSHVHFFERKWADVGAIPAPELERQLYAMLGRYGFTSVFDLGSSWDNTRRLRERIESGEVPGPRIRSTGEGLIAPGTAPSDVVLRMMGVMPTPLPEVANGNDAAAAARRLLEKGVDAIKLFTCAEHVLEATVREAHDSGKPVFVHPNRGADVAAAVRAGVDVIGHTTPHSGPWDESMVEARNAALTPTLSLWKSYARHDRISVQEEIVSTALGQLRAWIERGGTVLFGTDLGAVDPDPTEEYVLMSEAGMTFRQILASLTTAPAERFGGTGRIAPGLTVDLVVLNGDPAGDIRALADVRLTLRGGRKHIGR